MLTLKMTTAMSVMLVLQTTMAVAMSLGMYKSCLYECLHCVNTWGKDLFNGELCAESCAMSGGTTIDTTCTAYFIRSSRRESGPKIQFLHSEDPSGRARIGSFYNRGGYSTGRRGYLGYRTRTSSASSFRRSGLRSTLSSDCQRLCRTCESRFSVGMDAHSCMYTCVSTKRKVIAC